MRAWRPSLLWKILLSTSIAITLLFGITGWLVQQQASASMLQALHEEVSASFHVYDALWRSRVRTLASVSRILSSMSDVRAAFSTGDSYTIRDTASDLWSRIADPDAVFLVTDPHGVVIASPAGFSENIRGVLPFVPAVRSRFPEQISGFVFIGPDLFQVAVTPVYVQSGPEQTLINVVVAGYRIGPPIAEQLKNATGGSEFVFRSGERTIASTTGTAVAEEIRKAAAENRAPAQYAPLRTELRDLQGVPVAELWILRSFEAANRRIASLRNNIFVIYLAALGSALLLTSFLARRIVEPVKQLDRAVAEVARQNYNVRVNIPSDDEIGRLGSTFNSMLNSLAQAREELIRQERISTIGQLSTSIVHDLRNPLAAIYGGAEMLVDGDLPPAQVERLSRNIYRASRNIQELLQQLSDASKGAPDRTEMCRVREVVTAGLDVVRALADSAGVTVRIDIPEDVEVPVARARMERVFSNLFINSIEAMKGPGTIVVTCEVRDGAVLVDVADSGPGVAPEIRSRLFQPFTTEGKKNGLGLGLALSRQSVLNQGGDMWLVGDGGPGARFRLRLAM